MPGKTDYFFIGQHLGFVIYVWLLNFTTRKKIASFLQQKAPPIGGASNSSLWFLFRWDRV
jgi:F0F1-type ATP synthase membrane subunit b/b'